MELKTSALPSFTPFEEALIKCETESQYSDETGFINDNRSMKPQHFLRIDKLKLSTPTSKSRGRPSEIEKFDSFECEICGKITKTK